MPSLTSIYNSFFYSLIWYFLQIYYIIAVDFRSIGGNYEEVDKG